MTPARPDADAARPHRSPIAPVLIAAAVLGFLYAIRRILLPFVLGSIVAYVCTPLIDSLARRSHIHRWVFALAVLLVLMTIAAVLGYLGVPAAAHELVALAADPRDVIDGFVRVLMGNRSFNIGGASLNAAQIAARAAAGLSSIVTNGNRMLDAALTGFGAMFELILTWVVLGYLLFDAPRISQGLLWGDPLIKLHLWNEHVPRMGRGGPSMGWARQVSRLIDGSLAELSFYLSRAALDEGYGPARDGSRRSDSRRSGRRRAVRNATHTPGTAGTTERQLSPATGESRNNAR